MGALLFFKCFLVCAARVCVRFTIIRVSCVLCAKFITQIKLQSTHTHTALSAYVRGLENSNILRIWFWFWFKTILLKWSHIGPSLFCFHSFYYKNSLFSFRSIEFYTRVHHILHILYLCEPCISCVFRLIRLRNQSVNRHLNFNRNCSLTLSLARSLLLLRRPKSNRFSYFAICDFCCFGFCCCCYCSMAATIASHSSQLTFLFTFQSWR